MASAAEAVVAAAAVDLVAVVAGDRALSPP
jgi:hypothetical protein